MKSKTLNMTEGNPVKLLLVFALPMLLGNLFQQMYNLVDSVIVGKFCGTNALAAVGATGSVNFLFFALCNGLGNGGGIVTARHFGAGDEERVKSSIANSGYTLIFGAMIIGTVALILSGTIHVLLGTPEEIRGDSVLYMQMMCASLPLVALYNHVSSMLRALGDTRTPLVFLVIACALNIGLDIWFVYGMELGVLGVAIATVLSQLVAGLGCLVFAAATNPYFKLQKRHFRVDWKIVWQTLRMGIPLSLQFSLIAISMMVLQTVINTYGPVVVAAYTSTGRVEQLLHQPYGTLSAALCTFTGQNLGAKKAERLLLGYRKSLILMAAFTLIMVPIMQLFSENIIRIFVDDPEVIRCGAKGLRITSCFYLLLGFINMSRGILNGVGDAVFALINGGIELVVYLTVPFVLVELPMIGVWGIWLSVGICWLSSSICCLLRYFAWKKRKYPKIQTA